MNWIDRAEAEIEAAYAAGEIDYGEYHNRMRDLRDDIRGAAEEAAEDAYRDAMGGYW